MERITKCESFAKYTNDELRCLLNSDYGKAVECFEFIKKLNQIKDEHVLKQLKIDKANFYNFKCKKSDYQKVTCQHFFQYNL